ncbi:quinone oxidoreductase [Mucilaginibacter sp. L196]|uniref:quinone oxidoreductase family protein n=1 Tax=Mucilaginibacter sp. L196 TaxID=1641870 RepID=UPI00131DFBB0|nr:quinone oxidoreductase [Mucilaginibacter sp. L196]
MKALTLSTPGKSDVLEYKDVADPILKSDEILVKMEAIGLNFADIMRRNGVYPLRGHAPYINGYEGAGVVVDNNNNKMFKVGDRIGFADVPFANAELVAVPVAHAIPLPADISFETAASVLLQGLTAQYLTSDSHQVKPGETVLIHAAAGGVGQLLIQVCRLLGARVIGLTSSESKRDVSRSLGADHVFLYSEDWKTKILELFPNGVDVVYESVGSTMKESIEVTRICGQVVLFGLAGDKLELGNPLLIIANSITITGGDLWNYLTSGEERIKRAQQLFGWISSNQLTIADPARFKLSEGKQAHDFLESRKSTGKILLIP